MKKIAVCDDDNKILNNIAEIIKRAFAKYNIENEVAVYNTGNELLGEHREEAFDVIFLDIDMPKVSGFDVAKKLREQFDKCQIIFVTSYSELVYKSFDFQPFNFIQKNSNTITSDIEKVVSKLVRFFKQNESICLKDEFERKVYVPVRDILYIRSNGHYVYYKIKGKEEEYKSRQTMKECVCKFINLDFVQTHRQYLVNLRYLESIDSIKNEIKIAKINKRLVMSRNFKKEVEEKHLNYLRSQI